MKRQFAYWVMGTVAAMAVGLTSWWLLKIGTTSTALAQNQSHETPESQSEQVTLSHEKLASAQINTNQVARQSVQTRCITPGRLGYDESRHVAIKAATSGVVVRMLAKPGDHVEAGQLIAVYSSSEVGTSRAEVLRKQGEWEFAVQQQQRDEQIHQNVNVLLADLAARRPVKDLEMEHLEKPLGTYRADLLTAYSRMLLAESLTVEMEQLAQQGVLSGNTLQARLNERSAAHAAFQTVCERARYETRQQVQQTKLAVADAHRLLQISKQHVHSLLGYEADLQADLNPSQGGYSLVEVRSPMTGSIERRDFSETERVQPGDTLYILADTSRLWVLADIRENNWQAISLVQGDEVQLRFPALPNQMFTAQVSYLGREVNVETNSVPLVASLENKAGDLRPGMFVWVTLPMGPSRDALTIDPQAVLEHEGQRFAFIPEKQNQFLRVNLRLGQQTEDWIEVLSGLEEGQKVVTQGAYLLKSELLLEREAE